MEKKELHVVYIITKLELGGAQKVCLSLFEGIAQAGYSSWLISGANGILDKEVAHHSSVYLLPNLKRDVSFSSLFLEIKNFIDVTRHLKKLRKQYPHLIVHTHSTKAGLVGRWAALCAGIKKRVHTIHGYAFHEHQSKLLWLGIYLVELCTSFITTHFICVSSYDVTIGVRLFPRFKKKYSIIRAAVDWLPFQNQDPQLKNEESKKFVIGTISCFKKQKNIPDLLYAFHAAYQLNNSLRLEIIGDGILRPTIETLIEKLALQEVVTLHGWQPQVAPYMISWDLFALSSLWEGLPCAIIEARLLRLPVVSYNTGGITDVIIHGKNGLVYPAKQWQALAQAFLELSSNKDLYHSMRQYKDDLSNYANHRMINNHIGLYHAINYNKSTFLAYITRT